MARWTWSWKRIEGRKYEMSMNIQPSFSDVTHVFTAWAHNTIMLRIQNRIARHFNVGPIRGIVELEFHVVGDIWMTHDVDCKQTSAYTPDSPANKIDLLMRS